MSRRLFMPMLLTMSALVSAPAFAAQVRMFSYDPADAETRTSAGPMTFQFRQGILKTTVLNLRSTEADATVDVTPTSEAALGGARLTTLAGAEAGDRDLYAIAPTNDGEALVAALCAGSKRGWLAIERPRYGRDLGLDVLGDAPTGGVKLCRKLSYTFHGEWRGPQTGKYDPRLSSRVRGPEGAAPP